MSIRFSPLLFGLVTALASVRANADMIVTVGAGGNYSTINDAVTAANNDPSQYYVIEVAPGTYTNDFSVVNSPMTIELNPNDAGPVLLLATEPPPNDKGIITTQASLTVSGLTFEGAAIPAAEGSNGAGIRDQAGTAALTIMDSIFKNDQDGILADANDGEIVTITGSSFISDGFDAGGNTCPDGGGCDHAIYIGAVSSLTVMDSVFCGTLVGHDIKSRAQTTTITGNQIFDGAPDGAINCPAGSTSYGIDLANGGVGMISGNTITQGPDTQNPSMISYGEEGLPYTDNSLLLSDNDIVSSGVGDAIGVNDPQCVMVQLQGNTFQGVNTPVNPPQCADVLADGPGPVPEPNGLLVVLSALAGCLVIRAGAVARVRLSRLHEPA